MAARQQVWIARQRPDLADRLFELVPEPIGDPVAERRSHRARDPFGQKGMSLAAASTPMLTRTAQPGISNKNSANRFEEGERKGHRRGPGMVRAHEIEPF